MSEPTPGAVSVITPAFNSARTLTRAYESLAAQSFSRWEHIIVDDGSTDETSVIAAGIGERDPRVRVMTTLNRGQGSALNTGVSLARYPFIAFLDGDDEYLPDHLEAHIAFMNRRPGVHLVWGGVDVIVVEPEDAYVPDLNQGAGYIHASECVVQGTLFVRREVFDDLAFTEDRAIWYQDYEFVQRASSRFRVERFPLVTYRYYRDSPGSLVAGAKRDWPRTRAADVR